MKGMKRGILKRGFFLVGICLALFGLSYQAAAQLQLTVVEKSDGGGKIGRPGYLAAATNSCGETKFNYYKVITAHESHVNSYAQETYAYPGYTNSVDQFVTLTNSITYEWTTVQGYWEDMPPFEGASNPCLTNAFGTNYVSVYYHNYRAYDECMGYHTSVTDAYNAGLSQIEMGFDGWEQNDIDQFYIQFANTTSDYNGLTNYPCFFDSGGTTAQGSFGMTGNGMAGWTPGYSVYGWWTNAVATNYTSETTIGGGLTAGAIGRPANYMDYTDPSYQYYYYGGQFVYTLSTNLSGLDSTGAMIGRVVAKIEAKDWTNSVNRKAFASIGYGETFYSAAKTISTISLKTKAGVDYIVHYNIIEKKIIVDTNGCAQVPSMTVTPASGTVHGNGDYAGLSITNEAPSVGWPTVYASIEIEPVCSEQTCGCVQASNAGNNSQTDGDNGSDGPITIASIELGADGMGGKAGTVNILSSMASALAMTDPANLKLFTNEDVVSKTESGGVLAELDSPQVKVKIVATNTFGYQMRFYNVSNGFALTNSGTFVTWTVTNVNNSTNFPATIRIAETRGGSTIATDYGFNSSGRLESVTRGNGLTKTTKTESWSGGVKTVTWTTLRPSDDAVIAVRSAKYSGGDLVESSRGIGGDKVTDTFSYSTNRLILTNLYHSGNWSITVKNADGRLVKEFSPWLDSAPTTNASYCRVKEYSYTPLGGGDDGSIMSETPRLVVEKILGTEVSRRYRVITEYEDRDIRCPNPSMDWDDAANLVTIKTAYDDGEFQGWDKSVVQPNGVLTLYEYEYDGATNLVTTVYTGAPNGDYSAVTNGVKTVTIQGPLKETISVSQVDIVSNILIGRETYSDFDLLKRPLKVTSLNGDVKTFVYSCCNLESETDENGVTTSYTYDALKRGTSSMRAGVSMINLLDAAGQVVASIKQGTNATQMLVSSNVYNTAGEIVVSLDALEIPTAYAEAGGSNGRTNTVTYADGATGVQKYYRDGSLKSVGGTANHGVKYEYGVETEGGVARTYTKQTRLLANGSDSSEWVKTYTDAVGNSYKTVYPDEAAEVTYFNSKGQAWKQVDADGVVRLFQYNTKGQREYAVLDVDRNDTIDFGGTDRITRSLSYATNAHGVGVLRSEAWQWQTLSANTATLLSTSDRSVETKESWQFAFGLTNYSIHICLTNLAVCYSTNTAPDGSRSVSVSQFGLPLSMTRYDSNGVQLAQQSVGYDEFNRTITMTDAQMGTTTNTLDVLGRTLIRATPAPAPGQNPQTTQNDYDKRGRLWRTIQPDGGVVVNTYYDTGELKKTYGNRTYPVEYTYDYAGRMKTLKTWQDFANDSGAAVTTWNYDSQRGFMTFKRYADNKGTDYEYTLSGNLSKRTWARGVETGYSYNDAGDLTGIDYSDGTPDVAYTYDRSGRKITATQGSQDAVAIYYTADGQTAAERHTEGLLSGVAVTNIYDGLLRRVDLTVKTNATTIYQALYGYDSSSRVKNVSDGTNNASYSYVTNSSLVSDIVFKQGGTLRMTTAKQYDLLNRLTNITSVTASLTNGFTYQYNNANKKTKATREDGSYWSYGYDDLGQVTSGKRYWVDNTPVAGQQFEYGFDDVGNRQNTIQNSKPETRTALYTANLLNQYTSRTAPGYADVIGLAKTNATVTVNYQRTGRKGEYWHNEMALSNVVSAVYAGVTNIAVLNDASSPDIVTTNKGSLFLPKTPEQFVYDEDGNLTSDGRWDYSWDGENRLIQMETKYAAVLAGVPKKKLEFKYDRQSRRLEKKVSSWNGSSYIAAYTNRFVYDGWNLLLKLNPVSLDQSFLWGLDLKGTVNETGGIGGLVAINIPSLNSSYITEIDAIGSLIGLVKYSDGSLFGAQEYGPFGELICSSENLKNIRTIGFSSKFEDQETGLIYYGYRYMDPKCGRWLSRDWIQEIGGLNVYSYVANSSLDSVDAFGLAPSEIDGITYEQMQAAIDEVKAKYNYYWLFPDHFPASAYAAKKCAKGWKYVLPPPPKTPSIFSKDFWTGSVYEQEETLKITLFEKEIDKLLHVPKTFDIVDISGKYSKGVASAGGGATISIEKDKWIVFKGTASVFVIVKLKYKMWQCCDAPPGLNALYREYTSATVSGFQVEFNNVKILDGESTYTLGGVLGADSLGIDPFKKEK